MKSWKNLIFLLAIALFTISCEGPEGPRGQAGMPGADGEPGEGVGWKIYDIKIASDQWELITEKNGVEKFYKYMYDDADLTDWVYNDGVVMAFIKFEGGIQSPLPYTRYYGDPDGQGIYPWSEQLDYEIMIGGIDFYHTPSDFIVNKKPAAMTIRVVYLY